jgi:hypothetical protein
VSVVIPPTPAGLPGYPPLLPLLWEEFGWLRVCSSDASKRDVREENEEDESDEYYRYLLRRGVRKNGNTRSHDGGLGWFESVMKEGERERETNY